MLPLHKSPVDDLPGHNKQMQLEDADSLGTGSSFQQIQKASPPSAQQPPFPCAPMCTPDLLTGSTRTSAGPDPEGGRERRQA